MIFFSQELADKVHARRSDPLDDLEDSLSSGSESSESEGVAGAGVMTGQTPPSVTGSWVRKSRLMERISNATNSLTELRETCLMAALKGNLLKESTEIPMQSIEPPQADTQSIVKKEETHKPKAKEAAPIKQGYLLKQSSGVGKDWQRRFFRLLPDRLEFWPNEAAACKSDADPNGAHECKHFSLVSAAIKQATGNDGAGSGLGLKYRPDRFVLRTPSRALMCEASGVGEAIEWCAAIEARIQACIRAETGASSEESLTESVSTLTLQKAATGERLERLYSVPGNRNCADCEAADPDWASTTFGVLLCINCAGVHRSLGSHVSRIKSLVFDDWSSQHDQVLFEVLQRLGNHFVNAILDSTMLGSSVTVEERQSYIKQKYVEKALTNKSTPGDANKLLFESARTDDLLQTASLIFQHSANPNAVLPINGMNTVHVAASAGQLHQAALLVALGGRTDLADERGRRPAEVALRSGFPKIATFLSYI